MDFIKNYTNKDQNDSISTIKVDYYANKKTKTSDFLIGFLGYLFILILIIFLLIKPVIQLTFSNLLVVIILFLIISIFSPVFFFDGNRKFIGKGIIGGLIVFFIFALLVIIKIISGFS